MTKTSKELDEEIADLIETDDSDKEEEMNKEEIIAEFETMKAEYAKNGSFLTLSFEDGNAIITCEMDYKKKTCMALDHFEKASYAGLFPTDLSILCQQIVRLLTKILKEDIDQENPRKLIASNEKQMLSRLEECKKLHTLLNKEQYQENDNWVAYMNIVMELSIALLSRQNPDKEVGIQECLIKDDEVSKVIVEQVD